jgi:plastocyanin
VPATQARQQATVLKGVVGPGFTITLKKTSGAKVTTLQHGAYTIMISDKSPIHNFHLYGPGVKKTTGVTASGSATWKVTLRAGKYTYVCDPHAAAMKGTFRVT